MLALFACGSLASENNLEMLFQKVEAIVDELEGVLDSIQKDFVLVGYNPVAIQKPPRSQNNANQVKYSASAFFRPTKYGKRIVTNHMQSEINLFLGTATALPLSIFLDGKTQG